MGAPRKYPDELRERAVRLVLESREQGSVSGACGRIGPQLGIPTETLRNWVKAAEVERVIRRTAGDVLESLELFDLFEGQGVEPGFRSLAWTLIFRHPERTLTAKEIEARRERILSALQKELNVRPRSA